MNAFLRAMLSGLKATDVVRVIEDVDERKEKEVS